MTTLIISGQLTQFPKKTVALRQVWDDHNWHGMDLPLNFLLSNSSLAEKLLGSRYITHGPSYPIINAVV